jgi:hypothetical protein
VRVVKDEGVEDEIAANGDEEVKKDQQAGPHQFS